MDWKLIPVGEDRRIIPGKREESLGPGDGWPITARMSSTQSPSVR